MRYPTTLSLCGLAAVLFSSACVDGPDTPDVANVCAPVPKDAADRDLLHAIDAMGLCGSSAVDVGDGYVVEGDIYVARATLTDKQSRTNGSLVTTANIRTVKVRVAESIPEGDPVDDWRAAVQSAVGVWNAVPFSMVHMEYTTDLDADIVFVSDNNALDDYRELGLGTFPSGGETGSLVQINLDFNFDEQLSEAQKLRTAVHELGHNIGLGHTNWQSLNEGSLVSQISGTPYTDAASVMNGGEAGEVFGGLSSNDTLALQTIYPEIVTLVVEYAGCSSGTPRMVATWGGTLAQPTLEWQLDRYVSGTWSSSYRGLAQTKTYNVPTGQVLKLRVRGVSADGPSVFRTVSKTAPSCNTPPQ